MRLIDATRLVSDVLEERDKIPLTVVKRYSFGVSSPNKHGQSMRGGIRKALRCIEQAPTIDVVPVVHGEFEKQPEEVILNLRVTPLLCKTCRTTFITLNKEGKRCMCCSYCGAKMDGDSE